MIAMSEATDSTSDTMCVDSSTARSPARSDSRLRNSTRSSGSRPAVGSSTISTRGSASSAWAIPTRRSIPPENLPSGRRPVPASPNSSSNSPIRVRAALAGSPLTAAR